MGADLARLPLSDQILLWLDHAGRRPDEGGIRETQPGIAEATGRSRSQVSRVLAELASRGWVGTLDRRPAGFRRSIVAYQLTPQGRGRIADLMAREGQTLVPVVEPDGRRAHRPLDGVIRELGADGSLWECVSSLREAGFVVLGSSRVAATGGPSRYARLMEDAPPPRPFVGRRAEQEAFGRWLRGRTAVWTLEAPAGLGKSSLVAYAIRSLDPPFHLLWFRVAEGLGSTALLERFDHLLRRVGRPGPIPTPAEPEELAAELRPRVAGLPILVVVDDVQKTDAGLRRTVAALSRLAETERGLKLVLLGRELAALPDTVRVSEPHHLNPLSERDGEALLGLFDVPPDRQADMLARAAGNPLFLVLLARSPTSAIAARSLNYYLVGDLASTLPDDQKEILRWACALRMPASPRLFERLEHGSPRTFDALVNAGLLVRLADGRYEMHDLTREAFYNELTFGERRRIHESLADAFRPRADDWSGMAEFLHHLVKAGRREEAAGWVIGHRHRILARIHENLGPR